MLTAASSAPSGVCAKPGRDAPAGVVRSRLGGDRQLDPVEAAPPHAGQAHPGYLRLALAARARGACGTGRCRCRGGRTAGCRRAARQGERQPGAEEDGRHGGGREDQAPAAGRAGHRNTPAIAAATAARLSPASTHGTPVAPSAAKAGPVAVPDRHLPAADQQAGDAADQDAPLPPAEDRVDRGAQPGRGLRGGVGCPCGEVLPGPVGGEVAGHGGVGRCCLEDESHLLLLTVWLRIPRMAARRRARGSRRAPAAPGAAG